ncbi:NACHT domain-containing protein [Amycolatopsis sp. CB00013]|uniref:NACHT domain-containing protein n=1 Tax=Amycolatopsis sp. CB00013 TaxID=1703945 RepID=UPI00093F5155|nr:NACHT domain-containing protein [Amycolatopsis sp. CB00013]OKK00273.1 hypothetical protein AMK34_01060 [Amycolatopsis sp. CB00013]
MGRDERPIENRMDVSGDLTGAAVQAGLVHGGLHIHLAAPSPGPQLAADPPDSWDDLPELPPSIQQLLHAQVEIAQDFPYRLPGAQRPSLSAVYVRQDISSGSESQPSEPERPVPMLDSRGQLIDVPARPVTRLVVRPPSRTVRAALDDDDHLLITGGPGQGKSTLSLRLAADIATRWSSDGDAPLAEPVIPLRVTARELAMRLDLPFFQALAETALAEYGSLLASPVDADTLARRAMGCRWLLLVDGLDEVADGNQRDRLIRVLGTWASDVASSHLRVVLTSRPIAGLALAPFQVAGGARYELLTFDEEALRAFAANWFDENVAQRFVRQVHEANLDELIRIPLLATIAAIIFEQDYNRRLPDNRYELYEAYLTYLRSARSAAPSSWDHLRESLLEHLGRVRLEQDTSLVTAACTWISEHLPEACATTTWQEELTTYLAAIGPFNSRGGDLRFLHHSFAEHLAATAHGRLLPGEFDPGCQEFVRLLHAARLEERGRHARLVLLHYTRLHSAETDSLIRHLHAGNGAMHVLAARLLAWHAPASTETTEAFLATARGWASTTQYPSGVILTQVSRAAHHPGLSEWLCDLMGDSEAPWESRIKAARALATRLYGSDRRGALTLLRTITRNEAISVEFRFEAAKALADCGSAEHAGAVSGLRSVLNNPATTAWQTRSAATVLAGLGAEPRREAIEALIQLLEEPRISESDMVDAAMGLLEISAEFHDRCADVFRRIVTKRNGSIAGLRDATLGLASLGPDHLAEAAAALKGRLIDKRLVGNPQMVFIARLLSDLGPLYRVEAGNLLLASAKAPETIAATRVNIASSLAEFGPEFRESALVLLRKVLADRLASTNNRLWAARALADFGPEHHAEAARELERLARHPLAPGFERIIALGKLADLGEPYRAPAICTLRGDLMARDVEPDRRIRAGRELIRLGPEFQAEAARYLVEVASNWATTPDVRVIAWRELRSFGSALRHQASNALLALMGPEAAVVWETHRAEGSFVGGDTDLQAAAAEAFTSVLRDPERGVRHRVAAAHNLVNLGRSHHQVAVDGFMDLIQHKEIPAGELDSAVSSFSDISVSLRTALAACLRSAVSDSVTSATLLCETAEALTSLEMPASDVDAALRACFVDEKTPPSSRCEAAMIVARTQAAEFTTAVSTILRLRYDIAASTWIKHVRELRTLGADVIDDVRSAVSEPTSSRWLREQCAMAIAEEAADLREEALAEIRSQATDEFLEFTWRTEAIMRLVELDPSTTDAAIVFHRSVLDDEQLPVTARAEAGYQLVRLEPDQYGAVISVLQHLVCSPLFPQSERADVLSWLDYLSLPSLELVPLARAIVHDPSTSYKTRQKAAQYLPARELRDLSRATIGERAAPVTSWPSAVNYWHDARSVAAEVEDVLRETVIAPEASWEERVEAAARLAELSPRLTRDSVGLLEKLNGSGRPKHNVLLALAELDPAWRTRVVADARRTLDAEDQPWQQKVAAGTLLRLVVSESLPGPDRDRLSRLISDVRVADQVRLRILFALDRLDDIRAIRDGEHTGPAARWLAANWLRNHQCDDRERGAQVLDSIAGDKSCRPPLRWRAARELARFGVRGRALAAVRLQGMMSDEMIPVIVRVDAARVLGEFRPDLRGETLSLLRRLQTAENPRARLQVLEALGAYEPDEAARALHAMAEKQELEPAVRLRCADASAWLLRGYGETAAIVCRELAHDERVPRHIRVKAAERLALFSSLCRSEARDVLAQLS